LQVPVSQVTVPTALEDGHHSKNAGLTPHWQQIAYEGNNVDADKCDDLHALCVMDECVAQSSSGNGAAHSTSSDGRLAAQRLLFGAS